MLLRTHSSIIASLIAAVTLVHPAVAQSTSQESIQQQERAALDARNRKELESFRTVARETASLLERAREVAEEFLPRLEALKTNDDGKRLAANPETLSEISSRLPGLAFTLEDVRTKHESALALVTDVERQLAGNGPYYRPDAKSLTDLMELREWTIQTQSKMNRDSVWFDSALAKAPKDLDLKTAPTLSVALSAKEAADAERKRQEEEAVQKMLDDARKRGETAAQSEAVRAAEEKARQFRLETLLEEARRARLAAEANVERLRIENDLALRRQQQEAEAQRLLGEQALRDELAALQKEIALREQRRDEELAELRRQLAEGKARTGQIEDDATRIEIEARCRSAEVQDLLRPFVAHGYWQPFKKTTTSGPMSLSKLAKERALEPSDQGLSRLLRIASHQDNDRPDWPMRYIRAGDFRHMTSEQIEDLKRAQALLNELGPTLQRLGMLAE